MSTVQEELNISIEIRSAKVIKMLQDAMPTSNEVHPSLLPPPKKKSLNRHPIRIQIAAPTPPSTPTTTPVNTHTLPEIQVAQSGCRCVLL